MRSLTPSQIHALRARLDWSARQMGSFLDRSHQTIYNWESGSTRPDECLQAVLHALSEELDRRTSSEHGPSVSDWTDRLEEEGLSLLLEQLLSGHSGRKEVYAQLVRESERNGCLVLETPEDKPQMYLLPLTPRGLRSFVERLGECEEEEPAPEPPALEEPRPATS